MLWTTNSASFLAKTIAKENINARQADLWEWGTFSEEVYAVNFPTSWMFLPFFVSFMDSFSFFFASRHEWHCTQEGKKIFLLSSTLQALTTSTGSQKLALLTLPGSPWTDLNTEPHHLFSIKLLLRGKISGIDRIQQTTYTSFSRAGEGKRRELVTVNLPLYNIHFQITGDPCNLSGSHRCC